MSKNFVTPEGLKEFEKEYQDRLVKRREIAMMIKQAKEQGDLSENAEYSAAKAAQAENERKLNWLRCVIEKANVVEKEGMENVNLGCLVDLETQNGARKESMKIQIVGTHETDPMAGKISCESPLGKALMGRKIGDKVGVQTPKGECIYEVKKIG